MSLSPWKLVRPKMRDYLGRSPAVSLQQMRAAATDSRQRRRWRARKAR